MKITRVCSLLFCLGSLVTNLSATPSSLYWTNCTTDVQDTGTVDLGVDNYFTLFRGQGKGSSFSPDLGATLGLFTWRDLSCEVGIDYITGSDNNFFFNGKIGMGEGKLFSNAPSWSAGIFNIGTKPHRTNQDVVDLIVGKTVPDPIGGRLFVGGFSGRKSLGKNRQGVMVGYDRGFGATTDRDGTAYEKWHLLADFASGKNEIGGGGVGLSYYFNPTIWIVTGPTWFNDQKLNGQWKWTLQLNFGLPVYSPHFMTW